MRAVWQSLPCLQLHAIPICIVHLLDITLRDKGRSQLQQVSIKAKWLGVAAATLPRYRRYHMGRLTRRKPPMASAVGMLAVLRNRRQIRRMRPSPCLQLALSMAREYSLHTGHIRSTVHICHEASPSNL